MSVILGNFRCRQRGKDEWRKKSLICCEYPVFLWTSEHLAVQDTESPKNSLIFTRQYIVHGRRKRTSSIKSIQTQILIANHRWQLGGRKKSADLDQLALEDKSNTATRRDRPRYDNIWMLSVNAQGFVSPMDQREYKLGGRQSHQEFAPASGATKWSSDLAEVPDSTQASPRTSWSRATSMEVAYMVKFTFFFLIGSLVACLIWHIIFGGHRKSGRNAEVYLVLQGVFPQQEMSIPCTRRWGC